MLFGFSPGKLNVFSQFMSQRLLLQGVMMFGFPRNPYQPTSEFTLKSYQIIIRNLQKTKQKTWSYTQSLKQCLLSIPLKYEATKIMGMPGWPPPMPSPPNHLLVPYLDRLQHHIPSTQATQLLELKGNDIVFAFPKAGNMPRKNGHFPTSERIGTPSYINFQDRAVSLWSFVAGWVNKNTSVLIRSHVLIQSLQLSALHASKDLGFQPRDPLAEVTQKEPSNVNKAPAFSKKNMLVIKVNKKQRWGFKKTI